MSTDGTELIKSSPSSGNVRQSAVIVVTHDERMIEGFDRVYHLKDGCLERDDNAGVC